jgi:hypothetical protein
MRKTSYGCPRCLDANVYCFSPDAVWLSRLWTQAGSQGVACSLFVPGGRGVRSYFKHSVELVDGEGDIVDILAAVKDFLLAQATYQAARQRWPKERIRLSQQSRIVSDSSRDPS